jgi:hypothetical protein
MGNYFLREAGPPPDFLSRMYVDTFNGFFNGLKLLYARVLA